MVIVLNYNFSFMNDNDSIKSNNVMSKTCRFDQQVNSSFKE